MYCPISNVVRISFCLIAITVSIESFLVDTVVTVIPRLLNPQVTTKLGKINGKRVQYNGKSVDAYLSIPYVKPAVGDLRFKKPVPVDPWKKPIDGTKTPPACPQYSTGPFPWYDNQPGKSEDCLFLNIWVPSGITLLKKKAVMYWIFGGGFFLGSIRSDVFDGKALAATGDVIVVTVSYRLGALGFLYSATDDAPGNVAMYDMLEGLKWVNNNIDAFGGDKNQITIMGESAGSIAVGLLGVSPLTKGLYKRAIMESGSPAYLLADNNTQNLALSQKVAESVNCADNTTTIQSDPKKVVTCMRGVDAMQLMKSAALINPTSSRSFLPQYGDSILPKNPREAIINGEFNNNELFIGNNRDEGSFQIATSQRDVFGFFGEKNPQINKTYGEMMLRRIFATFKNPDGLVQQYLGNLAENNYDEVRRQVYTASGDSSLLCPTVYYAEKYAEKNNVYFYFFTHRPSTTPWAQWMGVAHFEEVQFVFGKPAIFPKNYTKDETDLSIDMMRHWTNFAKNG